MPENQSQFLVLAHNIRSLHNVGSIFRTADFFAVDKLFLTGFSGCPPDDKITKVALGAETKVVWQYQKSPTLLIRKLQANYPKLQIIGLENNLPVNLHSQLVTMRKFAPKLPLLLILGEEVTGIGKDLMRHCDKFLEIPRLGQKESLNVSVAFGIAVYAIRFSKND